MAANKSEAEIYIDWAKDYQDSARYIKEKIEKLKSKAEIAQGSELLELQDKIRIMNESYTDCIGIAKILEAHALRAAAREKRR